MIVECLSAAELQLWQLEFSLNPVIEHDKVRARVVEDLKRLRAMNLTRNRLWFQTLSDGYTKVNDKEGANWADEQKVANFPRSFSAAQTVIDNQIGSHS